MGKAIGLRWPMLVAVGGKGRCAIVRNGNKYTGIIA